MRTTRPGLARTPTHTALLPVATATTWPWLGRLTAAPSGRRLFSPIGVTVLAPSLPAHRSPKPSAAAAGRGPMRGRALRRLPLAVEMTARRSLPAARDPHRAARDGHGVRVPADRHAARDVAGRLRAGRRRARGGRRGRSSCRSRRSRRRLRSAARAARTASARTGDRRQRPRQPAAPAVLGTGCPRAPRTRRGPSAHDRA